MKSAKDIMALIKERIGIGTPLSHAIFTQLQGEINYIVYDIIHETRLAEGKKKKSPEALSHFLYGDVAAAENRIREEGHAAYLADIEIIFNPYVGTSWHYRLWRQGYRGENLFYPESEEPEQSQLEKERELSEWLAVLAGFIRPDMVGDFCYFEYPDEDGALMSESVSDNDWRTVARRVEAGLVPRRVKADES